MENDWRQSMFQTQNSHFQWPKPITSTQSCKGLQAQNQNTLKPQYFVADPEKSIMSAVGCNCHKKTPQIK